MEYRTGISIPNRTRTKGKKEHSSQSPRNRRHASLCAAINGMLVIHKRTRTCWRFRTRRVILAWQILAWHPANTLPNCPTAEQLKAKRRVQKAGKACQISSASKPPNRRARQTGTHTGFRPHVHHDSTPCCPPCSTTAGYGRGMDVSPRPCMLSDDRMAARDGQGMSQPLPARVVCTAMMSVD